MVKLEIQSDFKNIEKTIRFAIYAEIKRLEIALNRTIREITAFEDKYKITSEILDIIGNKFLGHFQVIFGLVVQIVFLKKAYL